MLDKARRKELATQLADHLEEMLRQQLDETKTIKWFTGLLHTNQEEAAFVAERLKHVIVIVPYCMECDK